MDLHEPIDMRNKTEADLTPEEKWRLQHQKLHEQHKGHDKMHFEMILILIGTLVIAQFVLLEWKRRHYKSYSLTTLLAMWLIPIGFCLKHQWWRFIFIWLLFSCITGLIVRKAIQRPIQGTTPRLVYKWFLFIYKLSYVLGIIGYIIMMATFFGLNIVFKVKPNVWMDCGLLFIFYGLYYGVLGRDISEICADKMASQIGGLILWFSSYVTGRSHAVRIGGVVSSFSAVTSGVPQGSHLGPILFLAYINDISSCFNHAKFLLYADDCKIYLDITSNRDCENLQRDLDRFHQYCADNSLFLNYDKCSRITFTRKRYPLNYAYRLGSTDLPSSDRISDLGVLFDSRLMFNLHVDLAISRALKRLGFMIRICRMFTNIQCMKTIYFSFVSSILTYASTVWNPQYAVHVSRIESVQRRFLRYLAYKTYLPYCDYVQRCRILGFPTLRQRRLTSDLVFLYKLINNLIDCPGLVGELSFYAPPYQTREGLLFRINRSSTNSHLNSPLIRFMNEYDSHCVEVDIFNESLASFRRFLRDLTIS